MLLYVTVTNLWRQLYVLVPIVLLLLILFQTCRCRYRCFHWRFFRWIRIRWLIIFDRLLQFLLLLLLSGETISVAICRWRGSKCGPRSAQQKKKCGYNQANRGCRRRSCVDWRLRRCECCCCYCCSIAPARVAHPLAQNKNSTTGGIIKAIDRNSGVVFCRWRWNGMVMQINLC